MSEKEMSGSEAVVVDTDLYARSEGGQFTGEVVLGTPMSGVEEPEPEPRWMRPGAPPRRFPVSWAPSAEKLREYFPLAWAEVGDQCPPVAADSGFEFHGRMPSDLWRAFVKVLERREYDLVQQQSGTLLIRSGTIAGKGKAAVIRCRRCGTDSAALDESKVCALGCSK